MGCCSPPRRVHSIAPRPIPCLAVLLPCLFSPELTVWFTAESGHLYGASSSCHNSQSLTCRSYFLSAHRSRLRQPGDCSVQGLLLVGLDGKVGGRVCDTSKDEAVLLLVLIQEGLVRLVHIATHELAGA